MSSCCRFEHDLRSETRTLPCARARWIALRVLNIHAHAQIQVGIFGQCNPSPNRATERCLQSDTAIHCLQTVWSSVQALKFEIETKKHKTHLDIWTFECLTVFRRSLDFGALGHPSVHQWIPELFCHLLVKSDWHWTILTRGRDSVSSMFRNSDR